MKHRRPADEAIHIKMSGCPNGCSQHHIANIGFYGASIKVGEHTIPAYVAHIGGRYEGGEVVYGTRLKVRLPAKRVPEAVERWLRIYEAERERGRGVQRLRRARRRRSASRTRSRDLALPGRVQPRDHEPLHRLERKEPFEVDPRRGRVRGLSGPAEDNPAPDAVERYHPRLVAGLLLPEGGVGADRHAACGSSPTRASSRSTPACSSPRPRDLARDRGALRREGRGHGRRAADGTPWSGPTTAAGRARSTALERALDGADAWITGMRREQAPTRADAENVEWDATRGLWKYNPLADWTEKRRLALHPEHDLPYNPLHDQRLRVDRLRALHAARRRPRGPLGRLGEDRVRPARMSAPMTAP